MAPAVRATLLWFLAGCYQPKFGTGAPCETSGDCPADQACVGLVCGGSLGEDAGPLPTDASPGDAAADGPIDAPPPAMVVIGANASQMLDTEIWGDNPGTNYGAQNHMSIDETESSLVWFEATVIPAQATVMSATLRVRTSDEAASDGGTVTVHRLREAWAETEATWLARASGQPWSLSGARPPARDLAAVASFSPDAVDTTFTVALPASLVQDWVARPAMNFGVILIRGTTSQHVHFRTKESGAWSTLTVVYQP